jgi:hypothetical protein
MATYQKYAEMYKHRVTNMTNNITRSNENSVNSRVNLNNYAGANIGSPERTYDE